MARIEEDIQYYRNMFNIKGKVAIVTGASGTIGKAISLALAVHGADLVLVGRNIEKLQDLKSEIEKLGHNAIIIRADVTNEDDVKNMVKNTLAEYGKIDILVSAAGVNFLHPAVDFPLEYWKRLFEINVTGTFLCDREVGKVMIEQKRGKIINISSIRGYYAAAANAVAYSSTKGAINMITKSLACEWAKYNVYVNAIAPSMVRSEIHMTTPDGSRIEMDPKILEGIIKRTPLKRLAEPRDICGAVIFLSSDASDFITGQIIYVDGGATAWSG